MADPVRFQHYQVARRADGTLDELGRGAMGVTYRAFDTNLRCTVALKVISATFLGSDLARGRFLREARAAAALRHPNVAAVFHLGEAGGEWFYAMEFVDGETLDAFMKRTGAVPAPTALRLAGQVARALGAAEKQGLVHRDIKPANLMLIHEDDGEHIVKVIDFGLAKTTGGGADAATLTADGFVGTPHFASPEQLEERELDVRSDIYSLGVTLYYMLAGQTPFSGSIAQVMSQHLEREPPLERLSGQHPALHELLRRMLAKNPADRQQNATELRKEIAACLAAVESTPGASPVPAEVAEQEFSTEAMATAAMPCAPPGPATIDLPKKRAPAAFGIGLATIAAVVGGGYFLFPKNASPPAQVVAATPLPIPEPTPGPTPTPDPFPALIAAAQKPLRNDPALALKSLMDLWPENNARPELRTAIDQTLVALSVGIPQANSPELLDGLRSAANAGFSPAQVLLAARLRKSDPANALMWFERSARDGNVDAMVQAGQMIASGRGVDARDFSAGAKWFEEAARHGSPEAQFLLAQCLLAGQGVPQDDTRALELLRKSAATGYGRALNALGDLTKKGIPDVLTPDFAAAKDLFEQAAAAGVPEAQGNLGVLYATGGPGLPQDTERAIEIFRDGAENKDNAACMFLYAYAVERGLGSLDPDPNTARSWYIRAARLGDERARKWCEERKIPVEASTNGNRS